jgi:ankyrin repeat protein
MNPLLEAILTESSDVVQRLLTKIPLNDQDNLLGQSALHLAVSRPQHLEALLKSGADVDARDKYGITPLMYASAIGNTQVAIRLLESGADPYPTALRYRNFLHIAMSRGHWVIFKDILSHVRHFPETSKYAPRDLLALGMTVLADDDGNNWKRNSPFFQTLLEWGANPNITCYDRRGISRGTLLHQISDLAMVKSIISHGFTQFNYPDSAGSHALLWSSFQPDPDFMELLLEGGSLVNHKNDKGHTTLHMIAQQLKGSVKDSCPPSGGGDDIVYHSRTRLIDCIRLLLDRKADPCLEDKCQCACSRFGCTPSNLILKEHIMSSGSRKDIWAMEFLSLVKETTSVETAKQCLLDMLRLVKFEELELIHTCHLESYFFHSLKDDNVVDDEDVEEILDEGKEVIETLEHEMLDMEDLSMGDLEQLFLSAICQRKLEEDVEIQREDVPHALKVNFSML